MPEQAAYKDPVRQVNQEFLHGMEVLSNREFPLPGARVRGGDRDPRFSHLAPGTGEMCVFNHVATVLHKPTGIIYVAFKKTMDALHFEQQDPTKYPQWLMDSNVKKTELDIYIHMVKAPYDKKPNTVLGDRRITDVGSQTRVHQWLEEIKLPWIFDTVAHFLLKNHIITEEMYGKC
jgi:hypothetical protein